MTNERPTSQYLSIDKKTYRQVIVRTSGGASAEGSCPGGQCKTPAGTCVDPGDLCCMKNGEGNWVWHRCDDTGWTPTASACEPEEVVYRPVSGDLPAPPGDAEVSA